MLLYEITENTKRDMQFNLISHFAECNFADKPECKCKSAKFFSGQNYGQRNIFSAYPL